MGSSREEAGLFRLSGPRVKEERIDAGLERKEVARRARIGRATLAKIEQSTRPHASASVVMSIAWAIGCEPADLFEPVSTSLGW